MHAISVTRSLMRALQQSSAQWKFGFVFWIDQISIDQASDQEKASQIAMMKTIYENAFMVLVWLGDPSSDSDLAFSLIQEEGDRWRISQEHENANQKGSQAAQVPQENMNIQLEESGELVTRDADQFSFSVGIQRLRQQSQQLFDRLTKDGPQVVHAVSNLLTRP